MGRGTESRPDKSAVIKAATSKAARRRGFSSSRPFPQVPTNVDPQVYDLTRLKNSNWHALSRLLKQKGKEFEKGYHPRAARGPLPDEQRIVVADVHGNYRNLYRLLLAAGAINEDGSRNPGFWVCQVGDLLHLGHNVWEADRDISLLAPDWVDCQLIGNHELPYLTSRVKSTFAGMHQKLDMGLEKRIRINMQSGHYQATAVADNWLISHAGADPRLLKTNKLVFAADDTASLSEALNQRWEDRATGVSDKDPLIDNVGYWRGGPDYTGSIFWCSWQELMKGYNKNPQFKDQLQQIVGHTPREKAPRCKLGVWNIDLVGIDTGMVAALIKDPNNQDWEPIVIGRAERPASSIQKEVLARDLR